MNLSSLALLGALSFSLSTAALATPAPESNQTISSEPRIISAGSAVTELIFALEAESQLVAVDLTSKGFVMGTDIPQVGYHRQLSAEGLMALAPTVLVGSNEMGPEKTLNTLSEAGIDVETVTSGLGLEDLHLRIDQVAALTGTAEKAETLKADVAAQMEKLSATELKNPPKVVFMLLAEGRPMTVAGNKTPVDTVIELAGAVNPAQDAFESYKPMSVEALIELQPDYILVASRSWRSMGGAEGILAKMPLLVATPAGEKNQFIPIPGPAIVGGFGLGSLKLAETLQQTFSSDSVTQ
ncbi:heme/hemin ABC transporter substrate-binding protein [Thaumasiovibrio subtropicus]|uniref:heme/hemin ABC transporter substrate-binding protein n=1 Tax=Thaumasiovibrio subtropicus TaxID=1891207 RepID=UPI000B3569BA|nr:ABC transporter substrate-binding protein [Thaumasiovibrio subtropicus]